MPMHEVVERELGGMHGPITFTGDIDWTFDGGGSLTESGTVLTLTDMSIGTVYGTSAANAASGLLIGGGTDAAPCLTSTADAKFLEFRCKTTATTGDNRLAYLRYEIGGVAGGECLRAWTYLSAAANTVRGGHISLDMSTAGSISGLGCALETTLHIPDALPAGGTYSSLKAAIHSNATASDPAAVTQLSFIDVVNQGHANGITDVDDKAFFITFSGGSTASGNVFAAKTSSAVSHGLRCRFNGTTYYLMVSDAQ